MNRARKKTRRAKRTLPTPIPAKLENVTKSLAAKDFDGKLLPSQREFAIKYIQTLDIEESYNHAYPNSTEASTMTSAYRLLRKQEVREYISELLDYYRPDIEAELGEIMSEVKKMAFSDSTSDSTRLQALKMLGQSKGIFTEKVEVTTRDIVVSLED